MIPYIEKEKPGELDEKAMSKSVFFTNDSHISLNWRAAQISDVICVFSATGWHISLDRSDSSIQFLGRCYIEGYIQGEAIDELNSGEREADYFDI